ncbi:unnamed protein product [marine sediment metagenome]|uniref:Uncharacterized protein n=1 Tax=marine sediment metagenome TaxID=412755 RepID=X1R763_9ZZZZ
MNDKKVEKKEVKFEITASRKDIILDKFGNPVPGFIIRYISERGSPGYIEISEKEYTKERALKLIQKDVERLEELL